MKQHFTPSFFININYFLLENECQDELSAESCSNIKEFGSCKHDLMKSHCKKTCDKCEDEESTTENEGTTAIPCNKYLILRLLFKDESFFKSTNEIKII